jgi:lycopene beta-cyclase
LNNHYDYIITGMGCAGLSLAIHMIKSKNFSDKKILLVDKDRKQHNDRTWCFWEKQAGLFDSIVYRKYDKAWIHNGNYSQLLELAPYQYKLIRGIDFYEYAFSLIRQHENFTILNTNVDEIGNDQQTAWVRSGNEKFTAAFIFNSILFEKPVMKTKEYWLLQHFKGWIIETETPVFNTGEATLMDFRVSQKHGTSFIYIMPFSPTRALVEYTLFTEELIGITQYDEAIKTYIDKYIQPGNYKVMEEEMGVIPMTNHRFPAVNQHIINIGTAGGQTKGSSGYTFRFIQKHSARITESLVKKKNPFIAMPTGPARFRFYDSVLLRILKQQRYPGNKIFTTLFRKNDTRQVLRFLDNESTYGDELKIISSLPTLPFLKAAIKQI